ncbi:MAG: M23 family metallopeptidase [Hyphomicrobium sp.]|nr:M23 family metallopeptidase [Hyphomicrobium sp.]
MTHLYRGSRGRAARADVYAADHADSRQGGRFRWLLSTFLAAAVGAVAIIVVIYGSTDPRDVAEGRLPTLERLRKDAIMTPMPAPHRPDDGLNWAIAKTDRLQMTTGATSTRYIIHETLKQRRNGREYIYAKPYVRIVSHLAAVPADYVDVIPPFNPLRLYADPKPVASNRTAEASAPNGDVSVRVVELLGGFLPGEDGQELEGTEVDDIIQRASLDVPEDDDSVDPAPVEAGSEPQLPAQNVQAPNTTNLAKTVVEEDEPTEELEGQTTRVVKVGPRDTLAKILASAGAETWVVREILASAETIFREENLKPGQEVHITLVPSLDDPGKFEPTRLSVFGDGHEHLLTVNRSGGGDFIASATPPAQEIVTERLALSETGTSNTLYAGLYHASLVQQVPTDTIMQVLRVHASETDFRRRLRADDTAEYFFDLKQENGTDGPPGELLYTAITTGGETTSYYRFRSADGVVDYYDKDGNNSRKFLMRKPIRGDLRLTSGFGVRYHPLLGIRKMHTGVDWAAPVGTPILAAGSGTIEEARHKSYNGNYVRIRHANGYQTAYSHMVRIAPGVKEGMKIRQGQIIGYVGSTGLSSGPHLHYEVLINTRFVDPLSIQVPRERKLAGRDLTEFQRERARIEELMRRAPVMTASR